MIDKQSMTDSRMASCHGMLRIAGGPMALATGGVGADGAWSGSGHPQQNTWGPSPSAGERVSESQAGHRDKTAHAGARARGESPSPPCCSVGHPLAPGPTAPSRQKGVSSSGPLPGVGVGGATHRLRWEGAWMGDGFMSETFSQEFVTTY